MPEITPEEYADFRRMRAEWKRYGIKKGATGAIRISDEIDGQKIGLDASALGGTGDGGTVALLIAEDAGPPVRYQYREITTPNNAGDAAANSTYDMVLSSTTGYAFEIDNRKCTVVSDPGAGTYTGDPWLVAIVRVYEIDGENYFSIDQTAQDDKPGWVSPVDQRWAGTSASVGRKTFAPGAYSHPTFKTNNRAYPAAGDAAVLSSYLGYFENDGRRNTDDSTPASPFTQVGVIRRDTSGSRVRVAELVDRVEKAQFPTWLIASGSTGGSPTYVESGPGLYADDVTTPHWSGDCGPGIVAVTDGTTSGGRFSSGCALVALGRARFVNTAGTGYRTGPMLVCGATTTEPHGMVYTSSADSWDWGTDAPMSLTVPAPGLTDACEHITKNVLLAIAGATSDETGGSLRYGVERWFADSPYAVWGIDADLEIIVPFPASVGWPSGATTTYTIFVRGGLVVYFTKETVSGIPEPPPDEV